MIFTKKTTRIFGTAAFLLFAFSLVSISPKVLIGSAKQLLANAVVGMTVGVLPNEYNTLAQQLESKQATLAEREDDLLQLEQNIRTLQDKNSFSNTLGIVSLAISLGLFMLIGANYYLDWRRNKKGDSSLVNAFSINLNKKV